MHLLAIVFKAAQGPAIAQLDAGQRLRLVAQHHLDKLLRNAVWQLGRAPRAAERADDFGGLCRSR